MKNNIEKAIEELKLGKMIIVTDDENRENEGDIVIAAEKITQEAIAFMAKKASGLICLAITRDLAEKLKLKLMTDDNQESMRTAFTISIDAKFGITTGISAADRAHTILTAIAGNPEDLVKPGHMFPLVARDGGVLERNGHTEAGVELAKMSKLFPAAVICEIMDDEGKMIRGENLELFAKQNYLHLVSIKEIVNYLRG